MPVSSYVVTAHPNQLDSARLALSEIEGAEIGEAEGPSFPVAVATESEEEAKEVGRQIETAMGVSKALLVYHNFEDIEEYQTR